MSPRRGFEQGNFFLPQIQHIPYFILAQKELEGWFNVIYTRAFVNELYNFNTYFNSRQFYWLLLMGGIVQSAPCNCDHLLIYCAPRLRSDHPIQPSEHSALIAAETPFAEEGRTGREMAEFCLSVSASYFKGCIICRNILLEYKTKYNIM
jgi:hypothetical protein